MQNAESMINPSLRSFYLVSVEMKSFVLKQRMLMSKQTLAQTHQLLSQRDDFVKIDVEEILLNVDLIVSEIFAAGTLAPTLEQLGLVNPMQEQEGQNYEP